MQNWDYILLICSINQLVEYIICLGLQVIGMKIQQLGITNLHIPIKYHHSSIVPSTYSWMKWDVTNDVQKFIASTLTKHGWKITDDTYCGGANILQTYFYSKENGDFLPYLEIGI